MRFGVFQKMTSIILPTVILIVLKAHVLQGQFPGCTIGRWWNFEVEPSMRLQVTEECS